MSRYLRLIRCFVQTSLQQELAYRANFFIALLHSLLNLGTGLLGLVVIFEQVESVRGWDFASTLAVLGVFLIVSALRGLFISPSLDTLAGIDGDVWSGRLDFTLLRPVDTQFLASFRQWRLFALFDLALGLGVLVVAIIKLDSTLTVFDLLTFLLALCASILTLYAILVVFTSLVFWSPGFLFTWVFDGIFQMARYPVGLYPGVLRLLLTWVIPLGLITTVPAETLSGSQSSATLFGGLAVAALLFAGASLLFHRGLRRYASASS